MSDVAESCALSCELDQEQRNFVKFLLKKCKPKLLAITKKAPHDSSAAVIGLLRETIAEVTAEIAARSEKKKTCLDTLLACGSKDGTEFLEVMNEMQEKELLEALVKRVEAHTITADPQTELKNFIDEVFRVLEKYVEDKKEPEEAGAADAAPEPEAGEAEATE